MDATIVRNLSRGRSKLDFLYVRLRNFFSLKSHFSLSLFSAVSVCFLFIFPSFVFAWETTNIYTRAESDVFGNECRDGSCASTYSSPNNNVVNVFNDVVGNVSGAADDKTANNNRVTVFNGTVSKSVYGANAVNVTNNSVTIEGGTITGSVYGGSGGNKATGNTVTIKGGTIRGKHIVKDYDKCVCGGYAENGAANNNCAVITGGYIQGPVFGGKGKTAATGNTVQISGNPRFSPSAVIFGGGAEGAGITSANRLMIIGTKKIEVPGLRNFEYYDFYLPESMGSNDVMMIVNDTVKLDNVAIGLYATHGKSLRVGDKYTLMKSAKSFSDMSFHKRGHIKQGFGGIYDSDIVVKEKLLTINVLGTRKLNPQAKVFSKGRAASIAFIGQGSELIADEGISAAATSLGSTSNMSDIAPFVAFVGGKSKYDTGLHIDISGVSLVVGGAKGFELEDHKITAGAFIEHGDGKYKSLNTIAFDDIKDVKANATAQYTGGGLLGRVDFSNNFYAEVSGRAGSAKNNFHSDDIKFLNKPASYDCDGMYLGAHIGSGYIYGINNKLGLDVSGKYFFTHQGSKDVELPTKEIIKFADTSSHKIRLGAKLTYKATEVFKPYVGGAFEYELAGKVDATLAGFDINASALKGGSGKGEFGVTVNVGKFLIDLGGRCHAGVRTGIDVMLKVNCTIDTRQVSSPSSKSSFSIGDRLLLVNAINTRGGWGINTAALPAGGGLRYITNDEVNNIVDSTRVPVVPVYMPVYIYHDYPYGCSQIAIYEANNTTLGVGRSAHIYRDYSCDYSRRATCCCSKSREEEREKKRQCRSITPYRNSTWY